MIIQKKGEKHMTANLIGNLPMILCLLLGGGLIVLEVFLPGFGLPGISGAVLIGAGVVLAAMNLGLLPAVAILLVVIAILAILVSWVLRRASQGGFGQSELFLHEKDALEQRRDMQVLVGRTGRATSVLRPAGIADFDGVRLNVVTEGGYIERDRSVKIVSVDGTRIVVREE